MALKIGLILTLTLNWATFQTLVFDLTTRAPLDVARIVAGPVRAGGSDLAASPLDGLQLTYDELALDAAAFGKAAGPNPQVLRGGEAAVASGLWKAQAILFMSTAGLLAMASVAVGVLATLGPIFIALFLFEETRGLFAGWLRAIATAALIPMLCWITTTIMLVVIDPWLTEMARGRLSGDLSVQTATVLSAVIFIFAAAQAALTFGAGVIAGGFQLGKAKAGPTVAPASAAPAAASQPISRPERLAMQLGALTSSRRLDVAGSAGGAQGGRAGGPAAVYASAASASAASGAGGGMVPLRVGDGYRRSAHLDRFRMHNRSA
jgi:type IV secretion system protein VirB6